MNHICFAQQSIDDRGLAPPAEQTLRQGHLWPRGTASFARAPPPKGCGRPRASRLGPGQSDLRRIHFSVVDDIKAEVAKLRASGFKTRNEIMDFHSRKHSGTHWKNFDR
jgi:hypothetical protein